MMVIALYIAIYTYISLTTIEPRKSVMVTPLHNSHTCDHFCRYRKVPSDKCEGGYTPQLAEQTVIRPCGVKPSPGPPARSSSPDTHFDTPVSIELLVFQFVYVKLVSVV